MARDHRHLDRALPAAAGRHPAPCAGAGKGRRCTAEPAGDRRGAQGVATWTERYRPQPADIRRHVPERAKAADARPNLRAIDEARKGLLKPLIDDWWRGHDLEVTA